MRAVRLLCLALCAALLCATLAGCALRRGRTVNEPPMAQPSVQPVKDDETIAPEPTGREVQHVDARTYFQQNAQVLSTAPAEQSRAVRTQAEVVQSLSERGLEQFPVTSDYAMDGSFSGREDMPAEGTQRRPVYQTFYITADEQLWTVYEINGAVMAYPASYNEEAVIPVMLSESGTLMSYDGDTNTFFETVPNPDVMIVRRVERIDAQALEQWTKEALDRR